MFERSDRGLRSGNWPLIVLALVLAALVVAAALIWSRFRPIPQAEQAIEQADTIAEAPLRPDEPLPLTLFIPVNGLLERVPAGIYRQPELQLEAREALTSLLASEQARQAAVMSDLELRALYLDPAGTAFVDLSPAGKKEPRGSAWDELLAVYALANTLIQNFTDIRQVRILVDGRESPTLAGHVDLSRAFVKRSDLIRQGGTE